MSRIQQFYSKQLSTRLMNQKYNYLCKMISYSFDYFSSWSFFRLGWFKIIYNCIQLILSRRSISAIFYLNLFKMHFIAGNYSALLTTNCTQEKCLYHFKHYNSFSRSFYAIKFSILLKVLVKFTCYTFSRDSFFLPSISNTNNTINHLFFEQPFAAIKKN